MQVLRIFISSPGDVGPERQFTAQVIQRLQGEFAAHLKLEPYFWEHEAMFSNRGDYQENIPAPGDFDIFICLLWSRMGSRLHSRHRTASGQLFDTGTRHEFDNALESARRNRSEANPHGTPDMLVFVKKVPPSIEPTPREVRLEKWRQYDELADFLRSVQMDASEDTFTVATTGFEHLGDFELKLEKGLRKVLTERLPASAAVRGRAPATWTQGSPFLGLAHYDVEHAPVFFGRAAATDAAMTQLRNNAAGGKAFVLLVGGSGVGKSSLARAGVLALLLKPGVVDQVGLWRRAILQPKDGEQMDQDLFRALARALVRDEALRELLADGTTEEQIAAKLRQNPGAVGELIKGGLSQAASDLRHERGLDRQPVARLALLVDQMEEIFTQEWITREHRRGFIHALHTLAHSSQVWVIGTLRSDFFHLCEEEEELMALKAADGQYHVQPPTESEIGQMIRWPAVAAGLSFEENIQTGERLDDLLRDDSLRSPEALPLMSFALEKLSKSCNEHGRMSLEVYKQFGGIQGALRQQAQATYEAFAKRYPAGAEAAFKAVMWRLTANPTGEGKFARQWAVKASCERIEEQRELLATFIDARLLVTMQAPGREAEVTLAHETLMREWPLLTKVLEERRGFFKSIARLNADLAHWQEACRMTDTADNKVGDETAASDLSESYLLEGRRLADAGGLLDESRGELTTAQIDFIERSRVRAEAGARRRLRRLRTMAAGFAGLTLVASVFAVLAWRAQREAQRRRQQVQHVQATSDFSRGQELLDAGEAAGGLTYLARAIEVDPARSRAAVERLWHALTQRGWPTAISAPIRHGGVVLTAAFSPDGSRVVTAGQDGLTRVWDGASGLPLGEPWRQAKPVRCAVFSPDGQRVLTGCFDGSVRVWEVSTGQALAAWSGSNHEDSVNSAAVSPRGRWAATGARDGIVDVWDFTSGRRVVELRHPENVHIVEFCPANEALLLTVSERTLRLWSVPGGRLLLEAPHDAEIRSAHFSPDGRRIVTAADDRKARIWNIAVDGTPSFAAQILHEAEVRDACFNSGGDVLATVCGTKVRLWKADGSPLVEGALAHRETVATVRFSPDGQRLLTGGRDGRVQVWAARTGEPLGEPVRVVGAVLTAAFHPNGRRILVATADGETRVWQSASFYPVAAVLPHGGAVSALDVSEDGRRLAVGTGAGGATLWDLVQPAPTALPLAHLAPVLSIAFSADGRFLATGAADAQARLWPLREPARPPTLRAHGAAVCAVAFSPDSQTLATATETGTVQCWSLPGLQPRGKPIIHAERISALEFSGDGRLLLTAAWDGVARVWHADSGEPASPPLRGEDGKELTCAAFSPTRAVVAVGSRAGVVQWWDAATGKSLRGPSRHHGAVVAMAFSRDGRRLVTASEDNTAVIWEVASGQPVCDALRHASAVTGVAFTPDSLRVATATEDGLTRLWDVESGQGVSEWMGGTHGQSVHGLAFSPDGNTLYIGADDQRVHVWDVTVPSTQEPQPLIDFARSLAAVRLQMSGRLEPISTPTADALRSQAQGLRPALDGKLLDWFFADPASRFLTPYAMQTVPVYLSTRLEEGTPAALDEAELLAAGEADALARLARMRKGHP